jgi:hypothetical protein
VVRLFLCERRFPFFKRKKGFNLSNFGHNCGDLKIENGLLTPIFGVHSNCSTTQSCMMYDVDVRSADKIAQACVRHNGRRVTFLDSQCCCQHAHGLCGHYRVGG